MSIHFAPNRLAGLFLLSLLLISGTTHAAPLKVVATFSIIADLATRVGGDHIRLTTLVGPNGDAHVYEPTPADAVALRDAQVVLANGLHMEAFLDRLVAASETRAEVVTLSRGAHLIRAATSPGDHAPHDPHAWQSVHNARVYVANIAKAFCAADPDHCADYRRNADAYDRTLEQLDQTIQASIAALPENRRTVITSHDAFGYFQDRYGLRFLAPQGITTEARASAADVATLIRQIRQQQAAALFVENINSPRLIERIAEETGLVLGGTLYSDALSEPSGPAGTYVAMMRHNLATLRRAINASAAPAGGP